MMKPRTLSQPTNEKKTALWNVQDLGDPYDIKRSMIAELPGDEVPMSENLELVCLLQAAQIERLSDFLSNYKFKFKDLERTQLDRHSYEIQIKQLTQKLAEIKILKRDKDKLREFVEKQNTEILSLKDEYRLKISEQDFRKVFSEATDKNGLLERQNSELKGQVDIYRKQLETLKMTIQRYDRLKADQMQKLRYQLVTEYSRSNKQRQNSFDTFKEETAREVVKLDADIRRQKTLLDQKDNQINVMKVQIERYRTMEQQFNEIRFRKNETPQRAELQTIQVMRREYETKISSHNNQIFELNQVLGQNHLKCQELQRKNFELETRLRDVDMRLRSKEDEIIKLSIQVSQQWAKSKMVGQQQVVVLQSKITELNLKIQTLNNQLKSESQSSRMYKDEGQRRNYELNAKIEHLSRENDELRRGPSNLDQLKNQLVKVQAQKALAMQEIERLNEVIRNKNSQSAQFKNLAIENQNLKSRINEVESTWSTKYEIQMSRISADYESRIKLGSQLNQSERNPRNLKLEQELVNKNDQLRMRTQELQKFRASAFEWQSKYTQFEVQQRKIIRNLELEYNTLKKQNAEHQNKLRIYNDLEIRFNQFQNRFSQVEGQTLQLKNLLRIRDEENQNLTFRVRQFESITNKTSSESSRQVNQHIQTITTLRNQNESLKMRFNDLDKERITEINRLTLSIKNLQEENSRLDSNNKKIIHDLEVQIQNFNVLIREKEDLKRTTFELDAQSKNLKTQSSTHLKNLQIQNENLKRQLNEMKIVITNLENDFARKGNNFEQSINTTTRENEDLRRKLRDTEGRLTHLTVQFENLNNRFRVKNQEYINMDKNMRNLTGDLQILRRQLKQSQITFTNKDSQVSRRYSNYQVNIQNLSRQNEDLKRKCTQFDNKLRHLTVEYEKVVVNLKNAGQEIEGLRQHSSQKENASASFQNETNNKIAQYEQSIFKMTRNNEDLQRKVNENDLFLKQKYEQYNRLQVNYRNITQELQIARKRHKQLEINFSQKMEGEVVSRYNQYQLTITQFTQERQDLRRKLVEITNKLNDRTMEVNNLKNQNESLRKKIEKYDISINAYEGEVNMRFSTLDQNVQFLTNQNEGLKRRQAELESRLALSSQELEKTNSNLLTKVQDLKKLSIQNKNIFVDLEATKKQRELVESKYTYVLESEVPQKYNNYEQTIREMKIKITQFQVKIQNLTYELDRVNGESKVRSGESNQMMTRYNSLVKEYDQFKRRVRENESNLNQTLVSVRNQGEDLKLKHEVNMKKIMKDYENRIVDSQNRIKIMTQEIQRLNQTITVKNQELEKMNRRLKEYEMSFNQKQEVDIKNRTSLEKTINNLQRQNEDLRRKIQQYGEINKTVIEYENRLKITGIQFQKTSSFIKSRNQQFIKLETSYRSVINQNQQLRRNRDKLFQTNRKIPELQQKIAVLSQEYQRLQQNSRRQMEQLSSNETKLRQQIQILRRQQVQHEKNLVNQLESQYTRKIVVLEQNIGSLNKEREELRRKTMEYQLQINNLMIQIERLNNLIKVRTEELQKTSSQSEMIRKNSHMKLLTNESQLSTVQSNYLKVQGQYENAKKILAQYEKKLTTLHGQFDKFQKMIQDLQRQRQDLYHKNLALSQQIERLSEQNQDLQKQTKDVRLRLSDESSLQKRINEHLGLMVILFSQVQSLRRRVIDKEKEVQQVRRSSVSPNILKH